MEKRLTCAVEAETGRFGVKLGNMCKHCSSVMFKEKDMEPYWKCNKYNVELAENEDKWLVRCNKCLIHDDK